MKKIKRETALQCQAALLNLGFEAVTITKAGSKANDWEVKLEGTLESDEMQKVLDLMGSIKPTPKLSVFTGPEIYLG